MKSKRRKFEQYTDMIARLYPDLNVVDGADERKKVLTRTVTFQVTDNCNLACKYCYQINKGKRRMSFETAKKFVDLLLSGEKGFKEYVSPETSPALIVEFIGGEPFMEIELIDQICDYMFKEMIRMDHPWAEKHCFSICSNGVLYTDPRVQRFLEKHHDNISFSVTIDGNKELHDSCRVFHDGSPSYDIASAAAIDWMKRGYDMGSKITIAPGNIVYLYEAIVHIIEELGYEEINCNCVYEKGWEAEHATELYYQLKKIADYLLDHDLEDDIFISIFEETFFKPKSTEDLDNWCFRAGTMISSPDGMKPIEDLLIGEKVFTRNGEIHEIENLTCHESYDNYTIKAGGMFNTFTTGDHPYLCKRSSHADNNCKRDFCTPDWISVKDIKKGDKIALSVHEFGNTFIDPSIAYIVGRYIGNGWCSSTGYKIGCIANEHDKLDAHLKAASVDYSLDSYADYPFNIFDSNLNVTNILNECGHSAKEKRLPSNIYDWSEESVRSLLQGLFDSAGNYKADCGLHQLNTTSITLASELLEVLRSLRYFPTCRETCDQYEIFVDDDNSRFMEYDEEAGIMWSTVSCVEHVDEPYTVYNLTVKDNHTFIANGALVHNCGGTGMMLSCDPDGYLYPCIRYMESSLGCDRPPYRIGDVDTGIAQTTEDKCRVDCLNCINRRTESTDECFYCPIAQGCSWCSAYNYQVNGTPDSRATYICEMHKARALANAYLWAKVYEKHNSNEIFGIFVPEEWALKIIPEDEWKMLCSLPNAEYKYDPDIIAQYHNGILK